MCVCVCGGEEGWGGQMTLTSWLNLTWLVEDGANQTTYTLQGQFVSRDHREMVICVMATGLLETYQNDVGFFQLKLFRI